MDMCLGRTVPVPCKELFKLEVKNRHGYYAPMITVKSLPYGFEVDVHEPSFFEKLFGATFEKKIEKAKGMILAEIEKKKRCDELCHTLESSYNQKGKTVL